MKKGGMILITNKKILYFFWVLFFLQSCNSIENYFYKPYLFKGEMIIQEEDDGYATLDFEFFNKSQKTVDSFDLNFYLFDEDGNPAIYGKSRISVRVEGNIGPEEKINSSFSLDKYLNEIPECPYEVDCLYISRILYSDGTEWKDTLGF